MKLKSLVLLLTLMWVGCSSDPETDGVVETVSTLTAEILDSQMADDADGVISIDWIEGDQITIFKSSGARVCDFTLKSGEDTQSGIFNSNVSLLENEEYVAVYPVADSDVKTLSDYKVSTMSVSQISGMSTLNDWSYLKSEFTYVKDAPISFEHQYAVVKAIISKPADYDKAKYGIPTLLSLNLDNTLTGMAVVSFSAKDWDSPIECYLMVNPELLNRESSRNIVYTVSTTLDVNCSMTISTATILEKGVIYNETVDALAFASAPKPDEPDVDDGTSAKVNGIEYGEGFIVFEANAAQYNTTKWKLIKSTDVDYRDKVTFDSGVDPINNNYLQYVGPSMMNLTASNAATSLAASEIRYKFTCKKSAKYTLVARMLQKTTAADALNDFWISMEGNFTTGTTATTEVLKERNKFYGRGVGRWGVANAIECEVAGKEANANPAYNLIEGEEYTLVLNGRTQYTCLDYFLLYTSETPVTAQVNIDLAACNPAYYRPNGPSRIGKNKVALVDLDQTVIYFAGANQSKSVGFKIYPSTAIDKSVKWESQDPNIVTVDQSGNITSHAKGETTITVSSNDGYAVSTIDIVVGKYIQTFDDLMNGVTSYKSDNGIEWSFTKAANGNTFMENGTRSLSLSKGNTMKATIPGGIKHISFQMKRMYDNNFERKFELRVNGKVIYPLTTAVATLYEVDLDLDVDGEFTLELANTTTAGGAKNCYFAIDNLVWVPKE